MIAWGAVSLALVSATVVACSSSTSPSLSADPRCGGIARVPAWQMVIGVHLADTGVADTFSVRLHQDLDPTSLTGAVIDPQANDTGNAYRGWKTGVPGGAFTEHDTLINSSTPDTISATAFAYAPGSEMYLNVDLKTCTATIGGIFFTRDSVVVVGTDAGVEIDTVPLGYAVFANVPVDSATAINGLVNPGTKVYTFASAGTTFDHLPQYQVEGLGSAYTIGGGSHVLDSATVGYIITAASAPAAPAPTSSVVAAPGASSRRFSALLARPMPAELLRP